MAGARRVPHEAVPRRVRDQRTPWGRLPPTPVDLSQRADKPGLSAARGHRTGPGPGGRSDRAGRHSRLRPSAELPHRGLRAGVALRTGESSGLFRSASNGWLGEVDSAAASWPTTSPSLSGLPVRLRFMGLITPVCALASWVRRFWFSMVRTFIARAKTSLVVR